MKWESVAFATALDLVVMSVALYLVYVFAQYRHYIRELKLTLGIGPVFLALTITVMLCFVDLLMLSDIVTLKQFAASEANSTADFYLNWYRLQTLITVLSLTYGLTYLAWILIPRIGDSLLTLKNIETTLRQENADLEKRVEGQVKDLVDLNDQLQAEMTEHIITLSDLRESEQLYRSIFEHAPIGMALSVPGGEVLMANRALEAFYGYSSAELSQIDPYEGYANRSERDRLIAELERQNYLKDFGVLLRRKGGDTLPVSMTMVPVTINEKMLYVTMVVDMSKYMQAQQALQESETRFRLIAETTPVPLLIIRASDGTISYANHQFGMSHDISLVDVLHKPLPGIYSDRAEWDDMLCILQQDGRVSSYELHMKRLGNGAEMWAAVYGLHLEYAGEQSIFLAFLEITERKQSEIKILESEANNKALLEAIPDIMFRLRRDGMYLDYHAPPGSALFVQPEDFLGTTVTDTLPTDVSALYMEQIERTLATDLTQTFAYQLDIPDQGIQFFEARMVSCAPDEVITIVHNITRRHKMEQAERVQREFAQVLAESALVLNSTLDMQEAFANLFDYIGRVIHHDLGVFVRIDGDVVEIVCHKNLPEEVITNFAAEQTVTDLSPLAMQSIQTKQAVRHTFAVGETHLKAVPGWNHAHSRMLAPVLVYQEAVGLLILFNREPDYFLPNHANQLTAFANQIAVSYQNTRLYRTLETHREELRLLNRDLEKRVEQRTYELSEALRILQTEIDERRRIEAEEREQRNLAEALSDVAAALTSTLSRDEVLGQILENVGKVVPHDSASVMLVERGTIHVVDYRTPNHDTVEKNVFNVGPTVEDSYSMKLMSETMNPIIVSDISSEPNMSDLATQSHYKSYLGTPIVLEQDVIGFIHLLSLERDFFRETQAKWLEAFAHHVSIAIRNAQSYEQAQSIAALEERQRLARDLHDSVSQTLFSANAIAEVLPRMLEKKPDVLTAYMEELGYLTRGAMAEMRALLFELRPGVLDTTELGILIKQLCDAFTGNTLIAVDLLILNKLFLPPDHQVVCYRIAQEALNNITKHANADRVSVRLALEDDTHYVLSIKDNGRGFEPGLVPQGHFGIQIMRERAALINVDLEINTELNKGTEITLRGAMQ